MTVVTKKGDLGIRIDLILSSALNSPSGSWPQLSRSTMGLRRYLTDLAGLLEECHLNCSEFSIRQRVLEKVILEIVPSFHA